MIIKSSSQFKRNIIGMKNTILLVFIIVKREELFSNRNDFGLFTLIF